MKLTEEQHRLVEAAQGKPVNVHDPLDDRNYVLLSVNLFENMRGFLNGCALNELQTPTQSINEISMPAKLRELPLPAEVAKAIDDHCRDLGIWRRKYRMDVEDELRLSYYFGGRYVAYLCSKAGPVVVAAGEPQSDEFGRQLDTLSVDDRKKLSYVVPSTWNSPVTELRTPFTHED